MGDRDTHSSWDLQRYNISVTKSPKAGEGSVCSPKMMTLFAPVRFNPVPPASVEIRKIYMLGSSWNWSIIGIPRESGPCWNPR